MIYRKFIKPLIEFLLSFFAFLLFFPFAILLDMVLVIANRCEVFFF
jgi:hypothetical protein